MKSVTAAEAGAPGAAESALGGDFASLFAFLPIGAYRSTPDGRQLRANPALARLNGFADEAEQIAAVQDIAGRWYVQPGRRDEFMARIERDGSITGFESEVCRYKTRERIWIRENAHLVRDAQGRVLYYEGTVEEITDRVAEREALQRSQRHLQQIVDLVPGVLYRLVSRPDGEVVVDFISPRLQTLFGVSPAQAMTGQDVLRRLRHPEDRDRVAREFAAATAAGKPLDIEYRALLDDGRVRWVRQTSTVGPPEAGCEVRIGLAEDITDRKLAELALREQGQTWRRALESMGDGVWEWDVESGVKTLSPQCLALYGYASDEVPETPAAVDGLAHPQDRAAMERDRQAHFDGRAPAYVNEHRVLCKDGSYKWVLSRGVVISRAEDGRPLRMIGTHTDITPRKQAQALRFERDRAAAADRAKSQFLSRVSHELRTPLNAILGYAQLLELERTLEDRHKGWVRQVLGSGRHLLALVDDVLALSSLQTGQLPLQPQACGLQAVVVQACEMLASAALAAGVEVVNGVEAEPSVQVWADRKRLTQIVCNLLSNGIKYNRPGGSVRLSALRRADVVEISVTDDGAGIAPEQMARLFNPFERLQAHRGPVAGTGLGLALSREFAQAMGGSLGASSRPGEGSTFYLRLPAA